MSRFDTYFLMKTEDIAAYVKEKSDMFSSDAVLDVKEIGDGNLNYVFLVKDDAGKSLIVKQAGETLRISDKMRISTERNRIESEILQLQNKYAPGLVPKIFSYDTVMCACLMEDLSDHRLMRYALMDFEIFPKFADDITTYMVNTTLSTTDIVMCAKEKKALVKNYINPELCEITEDLVFTEPYNDLNKRNIVFEQNKKFIEDELYNDKALHLEIAKIKLAFMTNAQALIHGDLHTGSIFVKQDSTKIFDPEFAFYGPIGYDVGNIIANLIFAWNRGNAFGKKEFCDLIIKTIIEIIDLFIEKFIKYFKNNASDYMLKTEDFMRHYLDTILEDTAAYAGTELIRRTVGMAQVKDITTIENAEKRAEAERINILCAKKMIMNRKNFKTGKDFAEAIYV
ncbi:MAG: S-methyl-5-thioribose kinase [Clostridiales bacterium]|jgi:5-methylthioribose kinase|nr:S-methyl-5-thioribose kinase [Clostridiales bacterium]